MASPTPSPTVTSPNAPTTTVSFLANVDINGQQVPINTGDITQGLKNFVFTLSNPVILGSLDDFLDYLSKNIGISLNSADLDKYIQDIPDEPEFLLNLRNALLKITSTALSITVLNIDVAAKTFMLGVSFPVDLTLTSFLKVNSVGLVVSRTDTTTTSPTSP